MTDLGVGGRVLLEHIQTAHSILLRRDMSKNSGTESTDTLSSEDELDLSGDSAVEVVTEQFTITEAELEETESDNGAGKRVRLTFESENFPFPINMRFFTEYTPADPNKNTDWVKRQRGQLKNVAKAATGDTKLNVTNSEAENYIVGKVVTATTKDGGDGFPVLSKFKKVS